MDTAVASPAQSGLRMMQEMGFPLDRCTEALRRSGGHAEAAMEWLLTQVGGAQLAQDAAPISQQADFVADAAAVQTLVGESS